MTLNTELISAALKSVKDNKTTAEREYDLLLSRARESEPELKKIEDLLGQIGAKIAITAISGNKEGVSALKEKALLLSDKKDSMLKKLGLNKGPDYCCKKCSDSGFFGGEICECVKETAKALAFRELFGNMASYPSFEGFDLTYYPEAVGANGYSARKVMTTTLKLCKEFADTFPNEKNLLFMGGCGLGKTHLSLALAGEVALKGYSVVYGSAQNLLSRAVRDEMDWNSTGEYTEKLLSCDLLVIDDLGTEFSSQPSNSMLYNIVNSRILSGKSTIISTNMEYEELEKKYDPRIVSRFIGNYAKRYFFGNDIRQIKATEKKA